MNRITTIDALRALYGPARERSLKKEIDRLDPHARRLIGLSPFVVLASGAGPAADHPFDQLDASPRGGEPGFVAVPDERSLLIPDAPGNNRLDTLENIARGGEAGAAVGLLFLVPGMDETLRVNGRAWLSTDPDDLARCSHGARTPKLAIRVAVASVYLHCAKAFIRSGLWDTSRHIDRTGLPSMAEMMRDQIRACRGETIEAETQAESAARNRDLVTRLG
jgi:hypothetical protein